MILTQLQHPQRAFELIAGGIAICCLAALVFAVTRNFATAHRVGREHSVRRSPVATGSMTLVLTGIGLLIGKHIGSVPVSMLPVKDLLMAVGLLLLVAGTITNLLGRVGLGKNWANQATIYADQTLVTTGPFALVRHPLYASLIWMCYGGALLYQNPAALLATLCIFYPMMIYRAGLEERMLAEQFPDYTAYRAQVGRFFPKMRGVKPCCQ